MNTVKQLKADLLSQQINSSQIKVVRSEIVESWLRSYSYGLHPYQLNNCPTLDTAAFSELMKAKAAFIGAADPYIYQLTAMDFNYLIILTDEQGTILRVGTNNQQVLQQVQEKFKLTPGAQWTEATVGTCSHVMSLILKSPIQLCGPEIYLETCSQVLGGLLANEYSFNEELNKNINQTASSSGPIFDAAGNLAGSITIISPYLHHQNAHSLGLAISTAWAIQNEYQLALTREILSVTLDTFDEAVITLNNNGLITKANTGAHKMFAFLGETLSGLSISDVIGLHPQVQSVLETGRPIFNTNIKINGIKDPIRLRSAQPLIDNTGNNLGCVLTLQPASNHEQLTNISQPEDTPYTFSSILGNSPAITSIIDLAQKFAHLDTNILIQGDSGTGKELFARAIHNESRPNGPFVAVNCAAIPKTLIESELFGYVGGSFTGAERQGRAGIIEQAHGGTLFLDEIGEMPLELQAVLLRVLEEKKVTRLGARRLIPVNFRLITATNKNLSLMVKQNHFREDLYYRLAVVTIPLPALRDRGADIILLAKHFIWMFANQQQCIIPSLSNQAAETLLSYNWPGNIRQLQSAMLYAVTMSSEGTIKTRDLPSEIASLVGNIEDEPFSSLPITSSSDQELYLKDMEKMTIMQALIQSSYNISEAAIRLGLSRSTLYRKMKKYQLHN